MPTTLLARSQRAITSIAIATALVAGLVPAAILAPSAFAAGLALSGAGATTPELIDAEVDRGEITEAQGALYLAWAFTAPERVPAAYVGRTPWRGTIPLLRLRERLTALGGGPAATAARAELRGPTFACPGTSGGLPRSRVTKHFYLQYDASRLGSLSIRRYATALETAWRTEVGPFGWAAPPRDPVRTPPGGRYAVRIERLGAGLYGYVAGTHVAGNNPDTPWNDRDAVASCMVLNRDYGPFPGTPIDALRATAAHEFNHSIQFGYGALTGFGNVADVFVEGLATWMEDEVFDSANDSYHYLWPELTVPMGRYRGAVVDDFPYPYWVVFRAMAERYGAGERRGSEAIYQEFWEQISRGRSTNLRALQRGLAAERGSLDAAFHDAAVALRFAVDCSSTARRFCLEEGPRYRAPQAGGPNDDHAALSGPSDSASRTIANDYAVNWIGVPTQPDLDLDVAHDGGRGILRVTVACRTGDAVAATRVGTATRTGDAVADDLDLSGCDEASVVVSNVKQTDPTPTAITRTDYTISIA